MTDPAGLGDRLRELSAEVADGATVWCSTLDHLAAQADEMERQRNDWRASIARVRAEVAAWGPTASTVFWSVPESAAALVWCSEKIRDALDGEQ